MGGLIRNKVRAFALLETVVALVIILAVFGIATSLLVSTGMTGISAKELRARHLLQDYSEKTRLDKDFSDGTITGQEFILRKEVSPYPEYDSLLKIHYYIYDQNKKLLDDWQQLVPSGESSPQ